MRNLILKMLGLLKRRCPRCLTGRLFRGWFTMNDRCPCCGLMLEREQGYFLGAMYVSYALSSALLIGFYIIASLLLPDWDNILLALLVVIPYLPFVPAVFQYSRAIWVYFDRAAYPTESSAGTFYKIQEQRRDPD